MLPGPVFNFELMGTARRSRFYLVRAFYAGVLFVILWAVHAGWMAETEGKLSANMISWFAFSAFCAITIGQEILVLILTPALVAGVIADEKQRKTLHYLMASRLSSAEIVLGKLMVRMLYVTVLLAVSLPVMSLLVLMGGVDPRLVLLACAGTLSTAWFVAALSIWTSTIARRVREAFFIAFGLECLWLFLASILKSLPSPRWSILADAMHFAIEWIGASSPIEVAVKLFFPVVMRGRPVASDVAIVAWMVGLQLAYGLALALCASWQLRPIFVRQDTEGAGRGLRRFFFVRRERSRTRSADDPRVQPVQRARPAPVARRGWSLRWRPRLGDRPMLWKELFTGRSRGLARLVGLLMTAVGGGFVFYYAVWLGSLAMLEMWDFGSDPGQNYLTWGNRGAFQLFLRIVIPLIYVVGILGVAGAAAASMTSEHEEDTWVSLTSTVLTGREIIFAKLLGAMKRGLKFAELIALLALAGAVAGSISPLSIPLVVLAMVVYGFAAAALGLWISLQLRSTWRAQFLTMALLLLVNVFGQGVLNMISRFGFARMIWPGFTPFEINKLLLDVNFVDLFKKSTWPREWSESAIDDGLIWQTFFSVTSLVFYSVLATVLVWHALHRFDVVAGRPRRPAPSSPDSDSPSTRKQTTATGVKHEMSDAVA